MDMAVSDFQLFGLLMSALGTGGLFPFLVRAVRQKNARLILMDGTGFAVCLCFLVSDLAALWAGPPP
jgi:hypothetical protein